MLCTMIQLFKYLRTVCPLSNDLREALEDNLHAKEVKRKDFLLKAGQICSNIYFVERGLIRSYYVKNEKELTSSLTKEHGLCVSLESFYSQQHGAEYIQALEDCHVYYLSFSCYQHLSKEFPEFNNLCRHLMEGCLCDKERRIAAMWMQPAEDRYKWLYIHSPDFFQRVTGRHLASYLGITEGMLSIIRGRFKPVNK